MIYKCDCGQYMTEEELEYKMLFPETLLEPEEGICICYMCGRDYETMEELDEDQIVELLNK